MHEIAVRAWVENRRVWIEIEDGRTAAFPAEKFSRFRDAPEELLARVQIDVRGRALRWEEIDEDLSFDGILAGRWFP